MPNRFLTIKEMNQDIRETAKRLDIPEWIVAASIGLAPPPTPWYSKPWRWVKRKVKR